MAAAHCSALLSATEAAATPNNGVVIQRNWVTTCVSRVLVMVCNDIKHVEIHCQISNFYKNPYSPWSHGNVLIVK